MADDETLLVPPDRPTIVETDGPVVRILCDSFELVGTLIRQGEELVLVGVHVDGSGPNRLGIARLKTMASQFLEDQHAERLVVVGAIRRTGACPGRLPKPMTFTRSGR